jgi:hypothetical protein
MPIDSDLAKTLTKPLDAIVFVLVLEDGTTVRRRAEDLGVFSLEDQIAIAESRGLLPPTPNQP